MEEVAMVVEARGEVAMAEAAMVGAATVVVAAEGVMEVAAKAVVVRAVEVLAVVGKAVVAMASRRYSPPDLRYSDTPHQHSGCHPPDDTNGRDQ